MGWLEANIARRRNIADITGNIGRQAGKIADIRQAEKDRRQRASQDLANIFMELGGRKWKAGEAKKERDWQMSEAEKERRWGTSERWGRERFETKESAKERKWESEEEKKARRFTIEHELPSLERRAKASRAEQNIYAGGQELQEAFDRGFESWLEKASAQSPGWFIKDELGDVIGYDIPDEGWAQFREYMRVMHPNVTEDKIDAYINSIRVAAQEITEEQGEAIVETPVSEPTYRQDPIDELLRNRNKIKYYPGMNINERYVIDAFNDYMKGGLTPDERMKLAEIAPQIMDIIDKYTQTLAETAREGVQTPGRGRR